MGGISWVTYLQFRQHFSNFFNYKIPIRQVGKNNALQPLFQGETDGVFDACSFFWVGLNLSHVCNLAERDDQADKLDHMALEANKVLADIKAAIAVLFVERSVEVAINLKKQNYNLLIHRCPP